MANLGENVIVKKEVALIGAKTHSAEPPVVTEAFGTIAQIIGNLLAHVPEAEIDVGGARNALRAIAEARGTFNNAILFKSIPAQTQPSHPSSAN